MNLEVCLKKRKRAARLLRQSEWSLWIKYRIHREEIHSFHEMVDLEAGRGLWVPIPLMLYLSTFFPLEYCFILVWMKNVPRLQRNTRPRYEPCSLKLPLAFYSFYFLIKKKKIEENPRQQAGNSSKLKLTNSLLSLLKGRKIPFCVEAQFFRAFLDSIWFCH